MTTFEYRKIDLGTAPIKVEDVTILNDAGKDGWELVEIRANNIAYMRRAAPATKEKR